MPNVLPPSGPVACVSQRVQPSRGMMRTYQVRVPGWGMFEVDETSKRVVWASCPAQKDDLLIRDEKEAVRWARQWLDDTGGTPSEEGLVWASPVRRESRVFEVTPDGEARPAGPTTWKVSWRRVEAGVRLRSWGSVEFTAGGRFMCYDRMEDPPEVDLSPRVGEAAAIGLAMDSCEQLRNRPLKASLSLARDAQRQMLVWGIVCDEAHALVVINAHTGELVSAVGVAARR